MRIAKVKAHRLQNIPIRPPPFRENPSRATAIVLQIETESGLTGWAVAGGHTRPELAELVNRHLADQVIGEDAELTNLVWNKLTAGFGGRGDFGRTFVSALSAIDIGLWDIKGQLLRQPVHRLLGGTVDKIPVYVTHGAAYGSEPPYTVEELVAEAKFLLEHGNRHLKNVVGRQAVPDPDDDYRRMAALREAVGDDVTLAMDGNTLMSLPQAMRLCKLTEDLGIAFIEEPVYENDPTLLAQLRSKTHVPIASAQNHKHSAAELLAAGAVDIIQPNVSNDGGYTGAMAIVAMAAAHKTPLGHGNGGGPHNIALQAGVPGGQIVEYHFHRWMTYNAIFEHVPQPADGYLTVPTEPGTGLRPKAGLIDEFSVSA